MAQRLRPRVRSEDTVARLGGDEFVVMLEQLWPPTATTGSVQARSVGEKILRHASHALRCWAPTYHSTPSIGIAPFIGQRHAAAGGRLLKQADIAMYQVKRPGATPCASLTRRCRSPSTSACNLEADLRRWPGTGDQF